MSYCTLYLLEAVVSALGMHRCLFCYVFILLLINSYTYLLTYLLTADAQLIGSWCSRAIIVQFGDVRHVGGSDTRHGLRQRRRPGSACRTTVREPALHRDWT